MLALLPAVSLIALVVGGPFGSLLVGVGAVRPEFEKKAEAKEGECAAGEEGELSGGAAAAAAAQGEEEASDSSDNYCTDKQAQDSCEKCIRAKPQQYTGIKGLGKPGYRCVWRHKNDADYDFLRGSTSEEATQMIQSDPDRWCPLAGYLAHQWPGQVRMGVVEQFECAEELGETPVTGAFNVALPKGTKLSDKDKGNFRESDVGKQCSISMSAGGALERACYEDRKNAQDEYVTVRSCAQYEEKLFAAWEESDAAAEKLLLPDIKATTTLANTRMKKMEPPLLEDIEKTPVLAGLQYLCGEFGHRWMTMKTGRIFDSMPTSTQTNYEMTGTQRVWIERKITAPWRKMVADQAKEKFCKLKEPTKACGALHVLLCQIWVNCICDGDPTAASEVTQIESFMYDLPWQGGGAPWAWRHGDKSKFGAYKEDEAWASQVIVESNTGALYLGDGHHRLMVARDDGKRAWVTGTCEAAKTL